MRIKLALLVLILASLACNANVSTLPATPSIPPKNVPSVGTEMPQPATTPSLESAPVVVPDAISSIDMLDAQNGWMITDQALLRTMDGGATWYDMTPPGASSLGVGTGASFLDLNRGWILIGDANDPVNKGMLYRTTDGGMTWASYVTPFGGGDLHFLDDANGWMMLPGEVLRGSEPVMFRPFFQGVKFFQSTDGGANWTQVYTNMPADAGAADSLPYGGLKTGFTPINMQEAWVSGLTLAINDFYLYHTTDGGHTWSLADYNLPFPEERYHVYPPVFFDAQFGILPFEAGSEGASLLFSFTEDGGKTWTTGEPVSGTSHYSVASPYNVFVWGLVSKDAGQTWTRIHSNVDFDLGNTSLLQFQFVDVQTGWAVARDDTNGHTSLYKTIDGGQTWTALVQ